MKNDVLISKVKDLLINQFDPKHLKITDDSDYHVGHPGNTGGAHLDLEIVSDSFERLNRIERHKLIYKCLDGFIPKKIHALKVLAFSTSEFENQAKA